MQPQIQKQIRPTPMQPQIQKQIRPTPMQPQIQNQTQMGTMRMLQQQKQLQLSTQKQILPETLTLSQVHVNALSFQQLKALMQLLIAHPDIIKVLRQVFKSEETTGAPGQDTAITGVQ